MDGQAAEFSELYHRHHQALYRYCLSIVRQEQDAQDVLQNTMVKANQALAKAEPNFEPRPWLFRVAHNECISLLRRRRQTTELAEDLPAAATTEQRHAVREELRQLAVDLGDLPEIQRSALVLRELSGLSHDEISQVLGVSSNVVKSTIFKARTALLQYREGREMPCSSVRDELSDGDQRVLRGRRQRAHLRDCAGCRAFQADLVARPAQLAALAPPLPAMSALALLHQLLPGAGTGAVSSAAIGSGSAALGSGSASAGLTATASSSVLGGVVAKLAAGAGVAALAIGGAATSVLKPGPEARSVMTGQAAHSAASHAATPDLLHARAAAVAATHLSGATVTKASVRRPRGSARGTAAGHPARAREVLAPGAINSPAGSHGAASALEHSSPNPHKPAALGHTIAPQAQSPGRGHGSSKSGVAARVRSSIGGRRPEAGSVGRPVRSRSHPSGGRPIHPTKPSTAAVPPSGSSRRHSGPASPASKASAVAPRQGGPRS